MLDLKKEEIERFDEKVREIAESVGCKVGQSVLFRFERFKMQSS